MATKTFTSIFLTKEEEKADKAEQAALKEAWAPLMEEAWSTYRGGLDMVGYCYKNASRIIKLDCGRYVTISKPLIETNFCFGYGTFDVKEYEDSLEMCSEVVNDNGKYFMAYNLERQFDEMLRKLENKCLHWVAYTKYEHGNYDDAELFYYEWFEDDKTDSPEISRLTENDLANIIRAYRIERGKFEKRLLTYLKKYGTSKLNVWNYWRDE